MDPVQQTSDADIDFSPESPGLETGGCAVEARVGQHIPAGQFLEMGEA